MRKWCVAATLGALFVLPLGAQQKDDSSSKAATETGGATAAENSAAPASAALTNRGVFAVPAVPRTTPFPGPQAANTTNATKDTRPPGRLVPKFEINFGYSYISFNPGSGFNNYNNQGGTGGVAFNANRVLGLVAEVGSYSQNHTVNGTYYSGGLTSYLFGPRLNWRFDHFVPFAEFLFGGAKAGGGVTGANGQNAFAMVAGGGVDVVLTKHVAWRFAEIDYL